MKPTRFETVNPKPFFKIVFGCSNRAFYDVKSELYRTATEVGIEINDGYITERCDYKGDLEEIIIYAGVGSGTVKLRKAVLELYGINPDIVPHSARIVLAIH